MSIKSKAADVTNGGDEAAPAAATVAGKAIDVTVSNLKSSAAQAAAGFTETQAKMKVGMDKAMKTAEELVAFGQGNLEAVMKSGQIWSAGVQDLSRLMAATAQSSFEETVSTLKALSGVKSLKDAMDLQANLARSAMEKTFSESGKLTDASFKLAEQTLAPITARMTMAVEKFAKPV
jgi:phasin family protein